MKVIKNEDGTLNIRATMNTLDVNEAWNLDERLHNVRYVRVQASMLARENGWRFTVNNARGLNGKIIITRVL